ncbi:MAG: LysM peptidoglycan-binding domain-containing protein [Micrococcales bacterium]|nr:LysM peptidoglycan-binding domain-containing protein [Micrococcales bacterium]
MPVFLPPAMPPTTHALPATAAAHSGPAAPHGWTTYVVRPGDTVKAIATRHRTTSRVIATRNHLPYGGGLIKPGQRLWVPRTAPAPRSATPVAKRVATPAAKAKPAARPAKRPSQGGSAAYRIRRGETLTHVAAARRTTVSRLLKLNPGIDPRGLKPGQRIAVPAKGKAGAAARPATRTARPATRTARPAQASKATTRFDSHTFEGRRYPNATVAQAARTRAQLARAGVPGRTETKAIIEKTARRHGIDPKLALAIAYQESGWDQSQVSVANAVGTMQVIPTSGEWASDMVGQRLDLRKTQDNVTAGVAILRYLTREAGSLDHAIAGYYQGLGSVREHGLYPDTKRYVANVKHHYSRL